MLGTVAHRVKVVMSNDLPGPGSHVPRHVAKRVAQAVRNVNEPERIISGCRVVLTTGDITSARVDAIVNAANSGLLGGGGVDGAIHRKGGPEIRAACQEIRASAWPAGLPTGKAVLTIAGRLPARYVIHTVGPVFSRQPDVPRLLAACHTNSLALAREHGLRTIAFPAISTGVYRYPLEEAAPIALAATREHLERHPGAHDEVRFVLFDPAALAAFTAALAAFE